jgi:3-oxoacyl-[acyl-carrier protein] reductase
MTGAKEEPIMDLELRGKCAMIWGASQGLGLAIAECLAGEGASVALVARSRDKLSAAASRIQTNGGAASGIAADLAQWSEVKSALDRTRDAFGDPDILVLNSGGPPPVNVAKVDSDVWRAQFEMMVLNQMKLAEAVHAASA